MRCHLLKDTASGAPQHPLHTYMGTSSTAEGNATEQCLNEFKVLIFGFFLHFKRRVLMAV